MLVVNKIVFFGGGSGYLIGFGILVAIVEPIRYIRKLREVVDSERLGGRGFSGVARIVRGRSIRAKCGFRASKLFPV